MRPTARQLAMRDPALAALVGAIGGRDTDFGAEFGFDDDDDGFGFEFGADAVAAAALPPAVPTKNQAMAAWHRQRLSAAQNHRRMALIEPNKGSSLKVERYQFSVNVAFVLGTPLSFANITNNPDTSIRPQRVTTNAPAPGFVTLSDMKVANVSVLVGGISDAFDFAAQAVGSHMDLPTLSPANRASVSGAYSGFVPLGYTGTAPFTFCVSFKGWASIVA